MQMCETHIVLGFPVTDGRLGRYRRALTQQHVLGNGQLILARVQLVAYEVGRLDGAHHARVMQLGELVLGKELVEPLACHLRLFTAFVSVDLNYK